MFNIVDKVKIYKDESYDPIIHDLGPEPAFYYNAEELLFTRRKLIRDGIIKPKTPSSKLLVAMYDLYGNLVEIRTGTNSF
jgi:hypothetical protein